MRDFNQSSETVCATQSFALFDADGSTRRAKSCSWFHAKGRHYSVANYHSTKPLKQHLSCVARVTQSLHVSMEVLKISLNKGLPAYLAESALDVDDGTHQSPVSTSIGRPAGGTGHMAHGHSVLPWPCRVLPTGLPGLLLRRRTYLGPKPA